MTDLVQIGTQIAFARIENIDFLFQQTFILSPVKTKDCVDIGMDSIHSYVTQTSSVLLFHNVLCHFREISLLLAIFKVSLQKLQIHFYRMLFKWICP